MRVYFHDQNPTIDHFAYKLSNARAVELLGNGEGELIRLADGRAAIQLHRSQAMRDNSWVERLEELTTRKPSDSPGMPYIKIRWPESVKALRAESLVRNVRNSRAEQLLSGPVCPTSDDELREYYTRIGTNRVVAATA